MVTTRERILASAIEELDANGTTGLRLKRVASGADVAASYIEHLFGNRDGLIQAACAERSLGLLAELDRSIPAIDDLRPGADGSDLLASFATLLEQIFSTLRRSDRLDLVESIAVARHNPEHAAELANAFAAVNDRLFALGDELREQGLFAPGVSTAGFVRFIYSLLFGEVICDFDPRLEMDRGEWLQIVLQATCGLVAAVPGESSPS